MVFEPNLYQSKSFSKVANVLTVEELANRSRPSKSIDCCPTRSSDHFHLDHREVGVFSTLPESQWIVEGLFLLTDSIKKREEEKR